MVKFEYSLRLEGSGLIHVKKSTKIKQKYLDKYCSWIIFFFLNIFVLLTIQDQVKYDKDKNLEFVI